MNKEVYYIKKQDGGILVYKIGICDDDMLYLKINRLHIEEFLKKNGYEGKVKAFQTYEKLMKAVEKETFHILVLDIDLGEKEKNGITLAEQFFKEYPDVLLVFVTGLKEFTAQAFEVEAMGYILKPVEQSKMNRILKRCVWQIQAREEELDKRFLVVVEDKIKQKIAFDRMDRIQRQGRKTIIFAKNREYAINETVSSLEERLTDAFLRVSQSDLVNKKFIKSIEKYGVQLKDGTILKIGRTYRNSVRSLYFGEE